MESQKRRERDNEKEGRASEIVNPRPRCSMNPTKKYKCIIKNILLMSRTGKFKNQAEVGNLKSSHDHEGTGEVEVMADRNTLFRPNSRVLCSGMKIV